MKPEMYWATQEAKNERYLLHSLIISEIGDGIVTIGMSDKFELFKNVAHIREWLEENGFNYNETSNGDYEVWKI